MVTQSININVSAPSIPMVLHMKQDDTLSRSLAAKLWDGTAALVIPVGAAAMMRFRKPDGTGGLYDTDEGGNEITITGSTVMIPIAGQVLSAAGRVCCEVDLFGTSGQRLSTFCFTIDVEASALPDATIISSDYYNILTDQVAAAFTAASNAEGSAARAESAAAAYPAGGSAGQVLTKQSATDYDAAWREPSSGVASVFGRTGAVVAVSGDYTPEQVGAAPATHASRHRTGGADALTPAAIGAAQATHASAHASGGADALTPASIGAAASSHASAHASGGADAITPASIGAASAPTTASALPASGTALAENTVYNVPSSSPVGNYRFVAPSGWAHGTFYTGSAVAITFEAGAVFVGAVPEFTESSRYEFDVLNGVWAFSEVVSE